MEISEIKQGIIKELSKMEEDCIYTSKNHFNSASIWSKIHYIIGLPLVIISAISITNCIKWLSIIAFILASIQTFISPDKNVHSHRIAGNSYLSLKNFIRGYKEYGILSSDDKAAMGEANTFKLKLNQLNESSQMPICFAFGITKKGIDRGEAEYKIDKENNQ